jgi:hypothetical protein
VRVCWVRVHVGIVCSGSGLPVRSSVQFLPVWVRVQARPPSLGLPVCSVWPGFAARVRVRVRVRSARVLPVCPGLPGAWISGSRFDQGWLGLPIKGWVPNPVGGWGQEVLSSCFCSGVRCRRAEGAVNRCLGRGRAICLSCGCC